MAPGPDDLPFLFHASALGLAEPPLEIMTPRTLSLKFRTVALATMIGAAVLTLTGAPSVSTSRPDQISELGLWLSAADLAAGHKDGESVTKWPDRSGNGYDAIFEPRIPQGGRAVGIHHPPTFKVGALAGQPAVSFDANDRQNLILNRPGHFLGQHVSAFSAAFLVRPTLVYGPPPAPGVAWMKVRYLFLTHLSAYNTRVSVQIIEDTGEVRVLSRPQPTASLDRASSLGDGHSLVLKGETWHRLIVSVDYKAKETRMYLDGTLLVHPLPPTSPGMFENIPSPVTGIGSTTLGDWLTCQIAEMMCYEKALTSDEARALDAYFCAKYSLK